MSVSERDREVARRITPQHKDWCQAHPEQNRPGWTCMCGVAERIDAIADAIAAERERVLAPVLAVAEELVFASDDLPPAVDAGSAAIRKDAREALADAADRIRRAAQDGAE
ncbi:MAG TPA: hypothetical protein VFV01_17095 [Spirillospora sp.]|nr:hypothetical protein [Spirillospora sp.]